MTLSHCRPRKRNATRTSTTAKYICLLYLASCENSTHARQHVTTEKTTVAKKDEKENPTHFHCVIELVQRHRNVNKVDAELMLLHVARSRSKSRVENKIVVASRRIKFCAERK